MWHFNLLVLALVVLFVLASPELPKATPTKDHKQPLSVDTVLNTRGEISSDSIEFMDGYMNRPFPFSLWLKWPTAREYYWRSGRGHGAKQAPGEENLIKPLERPNTYTSSNRGEKQ